MHIPQFTVQDFDEVIFLTLKMQPGISSVREKVGGVVIYTIFDDAGELGHFAIRPGPRISPEVMLKMFSKAASAGAEAPWFAFHSMPHSFEAVDERDHRFRTLCQLIFTRFVMRQGLDMAGRPTKLWDYVQQEEAPSGGSVDERKSESPEALLSNLQAMRQIYEDYNPKTAREIIEAIPEAWEIYSREGGRWGPGMIAKVVSINSTTIGRYLKAFREAGLHEIDGIEI